jgi:hypothetical protein
MQPYLNLSKNSNIISYEIAESSICVVFNSSYYRTYFYDYNCPGKEHVDNMKSLAIQGESLNTYIVKEVKTNFAKRW